MFVRIPDPDLPSTQTVLFFCFFGGWGFTAAAQLLQLENNLVNNISAEVLQETLDL